MKDYYERFPNVLKEALRQEKVSFPETLEKEYAPRVAFRGIRFIKDKKENIEKNDFLSQVERRLPGVDYEDIMEYSCSCFESIDELLIAFSLPRKNKGIAKGKIKCENGPIIMEKQGTHIHWFLYDGIDPSEDFEVCKYEKMG